MVENVLTNGHKSNALVKNSMRGTRSVEELCGPMHESNNPHFPNKRDNVLNRIPHMSFYNSAIIDGSISHNYVRTLKKQNMELGNITIQNALQL